ncbi:MAG: hypothetical protein RLZZ617_240 [Bacteroidota bacterium]|jgi:isopentenyl-diphosphate delta-isomerase
MTLNAEPLVILVDHEDREIGLAPKMEAHQKALLHRAFSVFVFNSVGELLLQQRSLDKYHSGGLWTNTCCSHPLPGESVNQAANRRLQEEMGMVCDLHSPFWFIYQTAFENGLSEHELDHVFIGYSDGPFQIDPTEVQSALWISLADLESWMDRRPEDFTFWFKHIYPRCAEVLRSNPALHGDE